MARPVLLKRAFKLRGTSVKRFDRKRTAMAPGKRRSAAKNVYYESRANRADISKTRRL